MKHLLFLVVSFSRLAHVLSTSGDCSEVSVTAYASNGKYYLSDKLFNGKETYTRRTQDPRYIYWTGTQWMVAKSVGASGWFATCSAARFKDCTSGIKVETCTPMTTAQTSKPTSKPTHKLTVKLTTPKPTAPLGGKIYKCCTDFATGSREAARKACQRGHDDLVTIFDAIENAAASAVCGASQSCWIGLKADTGGKLTWVNGASVTYTRFATGQPKLQDGACVVIDSQGQWKMASCTTVLPAVCEWPVQSFAAEAGVVQVKSVGVERWFIVLVFGGAILCCVLLVLPCVVFGRMKQGELQPLLAKSNSDNF